MLEALERGVKGGKWFALIDKVYEPRNLRSAFGKVYGNQGAAGNQTSLEQRADEFHRLLIGSDRSENNDGVGVRHGPI